MVATKHVRPGPPAPRVGGWSAAGTGETYAIELLLRQAANLGLRAPELTVVLGERAASLAEAAGSDKLWVRAESLVVSASVRLGLRAATVGRAVAALRAAEDLGETVLAAGLRTDLTVCARSVGVPLTGLAALRPVLGTEGFSGAPRAAALCQLVGCLSQFGRKPELDRTLAEADRLCGADDDLDGDGRLLARALLRVGMSSHRRRHADIMGAADAARTGLGFLEQLDDSGGDGGVVRVRLIVQLVCSLLDRGDIENAMEIAQPVLAVPERAASVAPLGWLRMAVATRVLLPSGAVEAAAGMLRDGVHGTERHGLHALTSRLWTELAHVEQKLGRPAETIECLYHSRAAEHLYARARRQATGLLSGEFGTGGHAAVDLDDVLDSAPRTAVTPAVPRAERATHREPASTAWEAERGRPASEAKRAQSAAAVRLGESVVEVGEPVLEHYESGRDAVEVGPREPTGSTLEPTESRLAVAESRLEARGSAPDVNGTRLSSQGGYVRSADGSAEPASGASVVRGASVGRSAQPSPDEGLARPQSGADRVRVPADVGYTEPASDERPARSEEGLSRSATSETTSAWSATGEPDQSASALAESSWSVPAAESVHPVTEVKHAGAESSQAIPEGKRRRPGAEVQSDPATRSSSEVGLAPIRIDMPAAPGLPLAPPPAEEPAHRVPPVVERAPEPVAATEESRAEREAKATTRHDAEHGSVAARSVLDRLGISAGAGGGRRRAAADSEPPAAVSDAEPTASTASRESAAAGPGREPTTGPGQEPTAGSGREQTAGSGQEPTAGSGRGSTAAGTGWGSTTAGAEWEPGAARPEPAAANSERGPIGAASQSEPSTAPEPESVAGMSGPERNTGISDREVHAGAPGVGQDPETLDQSPPAEGPGTGWHSSTPDPERHAGRDSETLDQRPHAGATGIGRDSETPDRGPHAEEPGTELPSGTPDLERHATAPDAERHAGVPEPEHPAETPEKPEADAEQQKPTQQAASVPANENWLPRLRLPPSLEPFEDFTDEALAAASEARFTSTPAIEDDGLGDPFRAGRSGSSTEDDDLPPDAGLADLLARALAEHQAGTSSAAALVKRLGRSSGEPRPVNGHGRNGEAPGNGRHRTDS